MLRASLKFIEDSCKAGMGPCPGPKLKGWVKDAGFTEMVHEKMIMPIGTWPADKLLGRLLLPNHNKHVGAWNHLQYTEGLEAFMMAIFTHVLGWMYEEVQVFMAMIKTESKDPKIHSMYHL
ncbi:MAG: hypothetical protein M1830_004245, partial [Pleopsidium flavum]